MSHEQALAVLFVFTIGFGIQRAVEMLEPLALWLFPKAKSYFTGKPLVDLTDDKQAKSIHAHILSFLLGLLVAAVTNFKLLKLLGFNDLPQVNFPNTLELVVSALVLGSGAEFANNVDKFLKYVKDAPKPTPPPPPVELVVIESTDTVKTGAFFHFQVAVKNAADTSVVWTLISGGGELSAAGKFTAKEPGPVRLLVVSKTHPWVYKEFPITVVA